MNTINIIGCGDIGKRLALDLIASGFTINSTVSSTDSANKCAQLAIPCKVFNFDQVLNPMDFANQSLIYLAPPPRHGQSDVRMQHFLSAIQTSPEKFVLISTTGVYGDCNGEWITEETATNPSVDRARRRLDAEQQVTAFCLQRNIPLVILRVAGIYGPNKLPVKRIRSGEPIVRKEDSPYTNRIHATDLVNICKTSLLNNDITGVYNVADGNPSTMCEYFNAVADRLGLARPPAISIEQAKQQLSVGMMSYMGESRRIDNRKLLSDFNLSLQFPDLASGLEMID